MILIDTYRQNDKVVLWYKNGLDNIRLEKDYTPTIYIKPDPKAKRYLSENKINYSLVEKKNYLGDFEKVLEIKINKISQFENLIKKLERVTKYNAPLYNADVKPEQMYIYENDLIPFSDSPQFKILKIRVKFPFEIFYNGEYSTDPVDFINYFNDFDPDVIVMENAYQLLPKLNDFLNEYCFFTFHRYDHRKIKESQGKTFRVYGQVYYRYFAIKLRGRILIQCDYDTDPNLDSLMEMSNLSRTSIQKIIGRSPGHIFQCNLIREMLADNILVPYKEKPIDPPMNLLELLKGDRAGHTFDAKVGFHKDVVEIDYSSMYPWIMYHYNVSADAILCDSKKKIAPGIHVGTSDKKGYIPRAIKPFLDKRMYYKNNPSKVNKRKSELLKGVLVSSNGYLRFREFKLGLSSSHMVVCAYSREIIVNSSIMAKKLGYKIIHGIVDSLYIRGSKRKLDLLAKKIEDKYKIPITLEHFKWIMFLPSVNDDDRPVPTRYFGVYKDGDIKVRGIELRRRTSCKYIKKFQKEVILHLAKFDTRSQLLGEFSYCINLLKNYVEGLNSVSAEDLTSTLSISKLDYKNEGAQKIIIAKLIQKGIRVNPGIKIKYLYDSSGIVLPSEFESADIDYYSSQLVNALFALYQPLRISKKYIMSLLNDQKKISDFEIVTKYLKVKFVSDKKGFSERTVKRKLEKNGWIVWRTALINILNNDELYPNVERKYKLLIEKINSINPDIIGDLKYVNYVHHGLPDFIAIKHDKIIFIEAKLENEPLMKNQIQTISKLKAMGLDIEVWRVVPFRSKTVKVNLLTKQKEILEEQKNLKNYFKSLK